MYKLLSCWYKQNKDKHGKHCHDQWRFFSVCPLSEWHALQGGYSRTHDFELARGRKNQGTHFVRTWLGQCSKINLSREVVLPHDPRSLPPHSRAGPVARLVLSIGPQLGAINCATE